MKIDTKGILIDCCAEKDSKIQLVCRVGFVNNNYFNLYVV